MLNIFKKRAFQNFSTNISSGSGDNYYSKSILKEYLISKNDENYLKNVELNKPILA